MDTPFSQWIAYFERGMLDHDATLHLEELAREVQATGRKGKLTLTVEMQMQKGMENVVIVRSNVETSLTATRPRVDSIILIGGSRVGTYLTAMWRQCGSAPNRTAGNLKARKRIARSATAPNQLHRSRVNERDRQHPARYTNKNDG